MLPRVLNAILPFLHENIKDQRFFDEKYDITYIGEYKLPESINNDR